jgi:hypothetical protein
MSSQERIYSVYYCDDPYGDVMNWFLAEADMPGSGTGTNLWVDDGTSTGMPPNEVPHRYYMVEARMQQ